MPNLMADQVADILAAGQRELGRYKFTDLSFDLQKYYIMPRLMKKEVVGTGTQGYGMQWQVLVNHGESAQYTGLYGTVAVSPRDGLKNATAPWCYIVDYHSYDELEIPLNGGAAQIVDLMKVRRHMKMVSLTSFLETAGWGTGPASPSDTGKLMGIPFWIQKHNSSGVTTAGFNGVDPTGWSGTGRGNLSSTTYPAWANWTEQYAAFTKADVVTKLSEAKIKTNFEAPVAHADYSRGNMRNGLYVNWDTYAGFKTIGESQNENLGRDIDSMQGKINFQGTPLDYVPKLDADTGDPIYGIDWTNFGFEFLKGWKFRESGPRRKDDQPNVIAFYIHVATQMKCTNLRTQFCLSK